MRTFTQFKGECFVAVRTRAKPTLIPPAEIPF